MVPRTGLRPKSSFSKYLFFFFLLACGINRILEVTIYHLVMKVKYIKEYDTNIDSNILEEVKGKYNVMRLDYRDRKLFYETMFCLENYYGPANLYSTSERGNPIKRELAHFVVWNLKNQTIILKDTPVDKLYSLLQVGKRKIQIVFRAEIKSK